MQTTANGASVEAETVPYGHLEHTDSAHRYDVEDKSPTPPPSFTLEEEKRVRRKADFVLLPIFCCIYALGFVSCRRGAVLTIQARQDRPDVRVRHGHPHGGRAHYRAIRVARLYLL